MGRVFSIEPDGPYRLVDSNGSEAGPAPEAQRVNMPVVLEGKKRLNDEKISLTNPEAKYWVERKIRERVNEETILQKHGEKMKENDMKKTRLEELNARRVALEEQLKIMKSRSGALEAEILQTKESKRAAAEEFGKKKDRSGQADGFQKAFESFASEIQRKINALQTTSNEKTQMLKEMNKREFIKQYEKEGVTYLLAVESGCGATRKVHGDKS